MNCQSWNFTAGQCDLTFHAEYSNLLTYNTRRGQITRVLMGFQGYDIEDFQPIFLGRVSNVIGRPPSWTITLDDATTLLQVRWTSGTTAADSFSLFNATGSTTTIASSWSTSDSSMSVASTSNLQQATGLVGAIKVDNGTDDPFYLHYTSASSGTISGITTNKRGTTAANSSSGTVTDVATLYGNPLVIFLRLLLSDGTGAGTYNIYPAEWGWMCPEEHVDVYDILAQDSILDNRTPGSFNIRIYVEESQDRPFQWLQDWTTKLGLVPVLRQGKISMRALQGPNNAELFAEDPSDTGRPISITDQDIIDLKWTAYHPDFPQEFQTVALKKTDGTVRTTGSASSSFPTEYQKLYDTSDLLWPGNENNICDNVKGRIQNWGLYVPYKLDLDCAGLRLSQLTVGDIILVSSTQIESTLGQYAVDDIWEDREAMVLGVFVDFTAGMVSLELGVIPQGEAAV